MLPFRRHRVRSLAHPVRSLAVALAAAMVGALALLVPQALLSPASAHPLPPVPSVLTVAVRTDPALAASLVDVPAQALPAVLAAAGTPFEVEVSLSDGTQPASFATDTTVSLATDGTGQLSVTSLLVPAGHSTATVLTAYSGATAALEISATTDSPAPLTAVAAPFPVDLHLTLLDGQDPALLGGTAGADAAGCAVVDAAHPMCGLLTLPRGAEGMTALTLGACPPGAPCAPGALVTQFLGDLTTSVGDLYTRTSPATMTIYCDKTLCGGAGVAHFRALWSESATGALEPAPACPAKGVIGPDQRFCTDFVASSRMHGGDLRLVVRFMQDVRGTI